MCIDELEDWRRTTAAADAAWETLRALPPAVMTWLLIKHELRRRVPAEEWKLWVLPTRLLHISPANLRMTGCALPCLILALPRSGRAIYKARGRQKLLEKICRDAGYYVFFTVAPDEYDQARIIEERGHPFNFLDPDPVEVNS